MDRNACRESVLVPLLPAEVNRRAFRAFDRVQMFTLWKVARGFIGPMTTQLDLDISEKAPRISADEIDLMINALRGKGWQTTTQLGATDWNQKRKLRAIAEVSDGRIVSFPGSPGYKLFDECVPEDFLRGDRANRRQARKMLARWTRILRRMHERGIVFPSGYQPEETN